TMAELKKSHRRIGGSPERVSLRSRPRRSSHGRGKLDPPARLIAPAHTLALPSFDGVKERLEFSFGFEAALAPVRALIEKGLVRQEHFVAAKSPVAVLQLALASVVNKHFRGAQDEFQIVIRIADHLEDHRPAEDVLFFVW